MADFDPSPKQDLAFRYLNDSETTELYFGGGAGSGKSVLGCAWHILRRLQYPGTRGVIGRGVLKNLKLTTMNTFWWLCARWGLKPGIHYRYNQADEVIYWVNGSQTILKDLAYNPSDPEFTSLGGLEITDAFVDEANEVQQKAISILNTRRRWMITDYGLQPKTLLTLNPSKGWIYTEAYKPWREKTLKPHQKFIQSLIDDNPDKDFVASYKEELKRIADPKTRARLLEGVWEYDDEPDQIVSYSWFDNAMVQTMPDKGRKRIAVDVSRDGTDKTILAYWIGETLCDLYEINVPVTGKSDISGAIAKSIIIYAKSVGVGYNNILIDAVGVGGGVVDALRRLGWYVQSFKGGSSVVTDRKRRSRETIFVENEDTITNYKNLRAFSYWIFRVGLQNGVIKIYAKLPFLETLKEELTNQKYIVNEENNEIQMEKKEKVNKRIGHSPDFADSVTMGYYCPKPVSVDMSFI